MGTTESAAAQTDGITQQLDGKLDGADGVTDGDLPPVSEVEPSSENDDASPDERIVRALADYVEERLAALNDPTGRMRRRFVSLLQGTEKKNASKRLALRARKFAQQGGRCSRCGQMFNRTRKLSPRIEEALPLVCMPCERADVLSGKGI